jgi:hypothetical protein
MCHVIVGATTSDCLPQSSPSGLSLVKVRVEVAEPGASVVRRELPVDRAGGGVAPVGPGGDLSRHRLAIRNALAQALALKHAQLKFGHIQPGAMLRGVVELQFVREPFGIGGRERRIQRRGCVVFNWSRTRMIRSAWG